MTSPKTFCGRPLQPSGRTTTIAPQQPGRLILRNWVLTEGVPHVSTIVQFGQTRVIYLDVEPPATLQPANDRSDAQRTRNPIPPR